jgi:tetratricopeptide (TPR) repeat protein
LQEQGDDEKAQQLLQAAVDLSPKAVIRQRKLGILAERNSDIDRAERAYLSAIRWGENSCFASAQEYRSLASIYHDSGRSTKMARLLKKGRKRFSAQPAEQIQMLCAQALAQQDQGISADLEAYLDEILRLVDEHKREITAADLLKAADDLLQLSRHEEARELLKLVLSNHHDDDSWVEKVRQLMKKHGLDKAVDELISIARSELHQIHAKCKELLHGGKLKQAINLLNDTVECYPRNRTLMLMAAGAMINYMQTNGMDPSYQFRCRFSLNRLLEKDNQDPDAGRFLNMLDGISLSMAQDSNSG